MPSVLPMQGHFPGGSASIVKWARRQSRTVEEYDFYFFFFLFCMRKSGRVVLINLVSNWSECLPSSSKAHLTSAINRPRSHVCTHCLGDRRITTRNTFLEIWPCKLRSSTVFFFFLPSITQRIGFKPPPSHMKVLSFVRHVWNFEMTPKQRKNERTNEGKQKRVRNKRKNWWSCTKAIVSDER